MAALRGLSRLALRCPNPNPNPRLVPITSQFVSRRGVASKLFVGGLSFYVSEQSLSEAFSPFGQVIEAKVVTNPVTNTSRGFGFVTFASDDEAQKAMIEMDGKALNGRVISVDTARPMYNIRRPPLPIARGPPTNEEIDYLLPTANEIPDSDNESGEEVDDPAEEREETDNSAEETDNSEEETDNSAEENDDDSEEETDNSAEENDDDSEEEIDDSPEKSDGSGEEADDSGEEAVDSAEESDEEAVDSAEEMSDSAEEIDDSLENIDDSEEEGDDSEGESVNYR